MPNTEINNNGSASVADRQFQIDNEVKEILGNPPSSLLTWGISAIFSIVLGMVAMSFVIKYPDVTDAEVIMTSSNPPITLHAKVSGKIENFLVEQNQEVSKGDLLLRYGKLCTSLKDLQYFLKESTVFKKIDGLQEEILHTRELIKSTRRQLKIFNEEIQLEKKKYDRTKSLAAEGLVSVEQFEDVDKQFLNTKRSREQLEMSITNNELNIERLESQILSMKSDRRSGLSDKLLALTEQISVVENEILEWKNAFLVTSPIAGKVNLLERRAEKQFINVNDQLMAIVPIEKVSTTDNQIIARAKIDERAFGRISSGNRVNIELQSYPSKEFGVITSSIKDLSLIPSTDPEGNNFYTADIPLQTPLQTTYKEKIPFKPNQTGIAKIITEDRSIAARIFEQFLDLFKNT